MSNDKLVNHQGITSAIELLVYTENETIRMTRTLRDYIADGYAINPSHIQHNLPQFKQALDRFKVTFIPGGLMSVISK